MAFGVEGDRIFSMLSPFGFFHRKIAVSSYIFQQAPAPSVNIVFGRKQLDVVADQKLLFVYHAT